MNIVVMAIDELFIQYLPMHIYRHKRKFTSGKMRIHGESNPGHNVHAKYILYHWAILPGLFERLDISLYESTNGLKPHSYGLKGSAKHLCVWFMPCSLGFSWDFYVICFLRKESIFNEKKTIRKFVLCRTWQTYNKLKVSCQIGYNVFLQDWLR